RASGGPHPSLAGFKRVRSDPIGPPRKRFSFPFTEAERLTGALLVGPRTPCATIAARARARVWHERPYSRNLPRTFSRDCSSKLTRPSRLPSCFPNTHRYRILH